MNVCKKNIRNLLYITLIIFIIIPIIFYIFFPLKEQFYNSNIQKKDKMKFKKNLMN